MKVTAINDANNSTFKGLWGNGKTDYMLTKGRYSFHETEVIPYHPFLGESKDITNKKVRSKFYDIVLSVNDGSAHKRRVRKAIPLAPLSFTKEEFTSYKNFYGKKLPEKFIKIEKELTALGLGHYKNSGFLYSCKKWLHNIVRF